MSQTDYATMVPCWAMTEEYLDRILGDQKGITVPFHIQTYTAIYTFCTRQPNSTQSGLSKQPTVSHHNLLLDALDDYFTRKWTAVTKKMERMDATSTARLYVSEWERFSTWMPKTRAVLNHLDSKVREASKTTNSTTVPTRPESLVISKTSFKDRLFAAVKQPLLETVLETLNAERRGEPADLTCVRGALRSYVDLSALDAKNPLKLYEEEFESRFIADTELWYTVESSRKIAECSVTEYMEYVEDRMAFETARCRSLMAPGTEAKTLKVCQDVLIGRYVEPLVASFVGLLGEFRLAELARLYRLLRSIDQAGSLKQSLESFMIKKASVRIDSVAAQCNENPAVYVEALTELIKENDQVHDEVFQHSSDFAPCFDRIKQTFVNRNGVCTASGSGASNKSAELLAIYLDTLLRRKINEATTPEEMEPRFDQAMKIFKQIEDKDVFQVFYSRLLSKRLIQSGFAEDESEATMLGKLKVCCGHDYVSKLQRMFQDTNTCKDLQERFKEHVSEAGIELAVDASYFVLASGSWPLNANSSAVLLPSEIQHADAAFLDFYAKRHSGRKLTWVGSLGRGDVRAKCYPGGGKAGFLITASAFQLAVLCHFNRDAKSTVREISGSTMLKEGVLKTTLGSLVKTGLLKATGESFADDDEVSINTGFKSKRAKFSILGSLQQKQRKDDRADVVQAVTEERKIEIQACIVRIMKARKTLKHTDLVSETISQISKRFSPKIPDIKRCIDLLLEKEYLERAEGDVASYNYLP